MRRLTVSELLTATGGTLLAGGESAAVTSVSTDSRKAGEGALFIPLTGERFDGHDYIDKALALGAAGAPSSPMLPRTATRRPAGKVAMERSAAAVESGLAL